MEWLIILGTMLAGIGLGATIGIIAVLTYKVIMSFKKKKHSVVVSAGMQEIFRKMANDPRVNRKNLADLAENEGVIAEYDPYTDNVDQIRLAKRLDSNVRNDMRVGGVCVYE